MLWCKRLDGKVSRAGELAAQPQGRYMQKQWKPGRLQGSTAHYVPVGQGVHALTPAPLMLMLM